MIIAVNTRSLLHKHSERYATFIFQSFSRLAAANPEHQFLYIFDRSFDARYITSSNIVAITAGPAVKTPLLWLWWYNYKVPRVLKKYKADVFVSADGCCSLRTKVPQCMVVHDLAFLHQPKFISRSQLSFFQIYTPKFVRKATTIATLSNVVKDELVQRYKKNHLAINVIGSGVSEVFEPIGWKQKEAVLEKWTGGKEYFIYVGEIHPKKNLLNLLKAFSHFKKWQKSNMQLLIVGRMATGYTQFTEDLKTYKYRDEIVLTGFLESQDLQHALASAYAFINPSLYEGFSIANIEAMRCGVPVIANDTAAMHEACGDAALYCDVNDHKAIAEKMMLLYKDENKRNSLINAGLQQAQQFTWDATAALLWAGIYQTVGEAG